MQNARYIGSIKIDQKVYGPQKQKLNNNNIDNNINNHHHHFCV